MGQRRVGDQTRRPLPSCLAVLASIDELDGVQSRGEVEHDTGKEGNRVEGGLGPCGPAKSWGPNETAKAVLFGQAGAIVRS